MLDRERLLLETEIPGHFIFEAPPDGFSPTRASGSELRRYGLPHRPDPKKFPKEARLWLHTMNRIKRFIKPKLTLRPDVVHSGPDATSTSPIWTGLFANSALAYTQIWGAWTVPQAAAPGGAAGIYKCAMWVGLQDGLSLFQAGTDCTPPVFPNIFGSQDDQCFAWYEWFPGPSVQIGLEVLPGHAVAVNLEPLEIGSSQGVVSMINLTLGVAITPIVLSPPTQSLTGGAISPPITSVPSKQADWILERNALVINGNPVPQPLADFGVASFMYGGAVEFDNTNGGKTTQDLLTLGENDQATLINMVGADNVTLIAQAEELPGLVMFYTGPT